MCFCAALSCCSSFSIFHECLLCYAKIGGKMLHLIRYFVILIGILLHDAANCPKKIFFL